MSQNKKVKRYFARKENFYISGIENAPYAEVILPIGDEEYYIEKDVIYSRNASVREKNSIEILDEQGIQNQNVLKEKKKLLPGDEICLGDYKITFFEKYIVIEGGDEIQLGEEVKASESEEKNISSDEQKISTSRFDVKITLDEIEKPDIPFEGYPIYKRSPRIIYRVPDDQIEIKSPPSKKTMGRDGLAELIVPVLSTAAFTVAMGVFLKRGPYVYMSVGMTAITTIFSVKRFFKDRKKTKEDNKHRNEIFTKYLLKVRRKLINKHNEEKQAYEYISPTTETIIEKINSGSSRLYERNLIDDDFLEVLMGFYDGKSALRIKYGKDEIALEKDDLEKKARAASEEFKKINNIPLSINLRHSNLGLVGSRENVHNKLKRILAQLTFFHSYHDLEIVFIHDYKYEKDFEYTKWYPHLKIHSINISGRIFSESGKETLSSLQQILKERKQVIEEKKQEQIFKPHMLFIIDEPKMVLNHPVMEYLQEDEQNLGFSIIYTTDNEANLPENIHTIVLLENSKTGRLLINEGLEGTAGISTEETKTSISQIPIGIETEQLNVVGLDISKEPALIIGESGMGRTNVVKCTLEFITKHVKETQTFIFDTTSMNLRNYSNLDNIEYATGKEQSVLLMEKLKELIENRKVTFEA